MKTTIKGALALTSLLVLSNLQEAMAAGGGPPLPPTPINTIDIALLISGGLIGVASILFLNKKKTA